MGRRGRGDSERPGRHEGGQGRQRERSEGAARDGGRPEEREDAGYKDRVHERLGRMDARLERIEQRLEKLDGGGA